MATEDDVRVGATVRAYRKRRGMSVRTLAGLAGLSPAFISTLENGERALQRRRDISAIAAALSISEADLIGTPYPPLRADQSGAHIAVPDVRRALATTSLDITTGPAPRTVEQLWTDAATMLHRREQADYEYVGQVLPDLIKDTHNAYVAGRGTADDARKALQCLILIVHGAVNWLKNLGYADLAMYAADRGQQAAERLDMVVWRGVAAYCRAQSLIGIGAHADAGRMAQQLAAEIPRDDPDSISVYAELQLCTAFTDIVTGKSDGEAAVIEAMELAERVGARNAFYLNFSPACVNIWRVDFAVEAEDAGKAIQIAEATNYNDIPARTRLAHMWTGYGRALALAEKDPDAVHAFVTGESIAPDRVRNNVFVRESTVQIVQRARRNAGGPELQGLVARLGLEV